MSKTNRILGGVCLTLVCTLSYPTHDASANSGHWFFAHMNGYEESTAKSTEARGVFKAWLSGDGSELHYKMFVKGFASSVSAAHIHFGRSRNDGGVMVFLCGGASSPACVQEGTVSGTLTASDVQGPVSQGIDPGEFDEFIRALRARAGYINVQNATAVP